MEMRLTALLTALMLLCAATAMAGYTIVIRPQIVPPRLKATVIDEIKAIRKMALAQVAVDAGVLAVYDENYRASQAYKAGAGATTIMRNGMTAEAYLAGMSAQMGMTPAAFADYILAENLKTASAYQVEQEYLRLAYSVIPASADIAAILAAPAAFRAFCGLN